MTNQAAIKQSQTDNTEGMVNGIHMETLMGTVNAIRDAQARAV